MRAVLPIVFLIWTALYLLDYPAPIGDDLYFSGAAINIAQGKGYANPYIDWYHSNEHFYVYVPLGIYAMAAWIKAFGICRATLSLFQCCAGAAASVALVALVGSEKRKVFSTVILSLLVAAFLSALGLRPDFLGLALFLGGALILKVRSNWAWTLCSFSLALTAICTPNFTVLIPVLLVSALYVRSELVWPPQRETIYRLAASIAAAAVAFLQFLEMIHFELKAFLAVFLPLSKSARYGWYLHFMEHGVHNVFRICFFSAVSLTVLLAAKFQPELFAVRVTWGTIIAFLSGMVGLIVVYFSSMNGALWLNSYQCLIVIWLLLHLNGSNVRVYGAVGVLFFLTLLHHRDRVIQLVAVPLRAPRFYQPEIKAEIEATHADRVYIDPFALASVYNYQIPDHTFDYFFGFPKPLQSIKEIAPNSLLVISPAYMVNDGVPIAPSLFGKVSIDFTRDPYKFVLIKVP